MLNGGAGEAGAGGAGPTYTTGMVTRGAEIVRGVALCGGCHTAMGGTELGGNANFKKGTTPLPAPNLTPDATGLGHWTDEQIMNAFRNGVDDEGRHLDPVMPYWLFHNMSDADALAVVAFLRSLPKVQATIGDMNPDAAPVTPLAPSALPDSSLASSDPNYAAAQTGKYLVSGVAQCVKCHSPSTGGLPSVSFFSGVPPANNTTIFAPNITPDTSGINGWSADDVVTALKLGRNKTNVTLCGSMPSAAKGYVNMSDADAHAIGVYLTTIPAVSKPTADPSLEPACP
jgi:mono/diheme cytochrome c family protein